MPPKRPFKSQTPKQKGNPKLGSKPPMSEPLKKKKKTMIDYDEDSDASDDSFTALKTKLTSAGFKAAKDQHSKVQTPVKPGTPAQKSKSVKNTPKPDSQNKDTPKVDKKVKSTSKQGTPIVKNKNSPKIEVKGKNTPKPNGHIVQNKNTPKIEMKGKNTCKPGTPVVKNKDAEEADSDDDSEDDDNDEEENEEEEDNDNEDDNNEDDADNDDVKMVEKEDKKSERKTKRDSAADREKRMLVMLDVPQKVRPDLIHKLSADIKSVRMVKKRSTKKGQKLFISLVTLLFDDVETMEKNLKELYGKEFLGKPLNLKRYRSRFSENVSDEQQLLATRTLSIQAKRLYLDVKQNKLGRFIKLSQVDSGRMRSFVLLAMSSFAEFQDHLTDLCEHYSSLGPPNPDNLPKDGNLKSAMMSKDNKRYFLDLKENKWGRYLRVVQTVERGGPRSQITIPSEGLIEFRDALTDLFDEFGSDDHAGKKEEKDKAGKKEEKDKAKKKEVKDKVSGVLELATSTLSIQSKRYSLYVTQSRHGRSIKIEEADAGGKKGLLNLRALSSAAKFRDHLTDFSEHCSSLGPPDPDNLPEDGKLKSAMIPRDELRYHLDLKENKRGRFLKVVQAYQEGGVLISQIVIPAEGLIEFRDALTDLLDKFGSDDNQEYLRLYVTGLEKTMTKEKLKTMFPNSKSIVLPMNYNYTEIRGIAFVEFDSHLKAKKALEKNQDKAPIIVRKDTKPGVPRIERAPVSDAEAEMDPLKLYVSGITSKESEEKLQKMFPKARNIECIKDKKGVYKIGGFVHFDNEKQCKKALEKHQNNKEFIVVQGRKSNLYKEKGSKKEVVKKEVAKKEVTKKEMSKKDVKAVKRKGPEMKMEVVAKKPATKMSEKNKKPQIKMEVDEDDEEDDDADEDDDDEDDDVDEDDDEDDDVDEDDDEDDNDSEDDSLPMKGKVPKSKGIVQKMDVDEEEEDDDDDDDDEDEDDDDDDDDESDDE